MRCSVAAIWAFAALAGCGNGGDSIVVVRVEAGQELGPIVQLRVGVTNRGLMDTKVFEQADGTAMVFPKTLALVVPSEKDGPLDLDVVGLGEGGNSVARGRGRGDLVRSKRVDVIVALVAGTDEVCAQVPASCPSSSPDAAPNPPSSDAGAATDVQTSNPQDGSVIDGLASPDSPGLFDLAGRDHAASDLGERAIGADCDRPESCASGHCVDGVCCDDACTGTCSVCNLPGRKGRCSPAPAGQDPRDACAVGAGPCGGDGTCDGAGACRRAATGTRCAPAMCDVGQLTGESTCDGTGRCVTPAPQPCAAGCAADRASCASPPAKRRNGESCAGGNECTSGVCADGVCCASDCAKSCYACNVPGRLGMCVPVPDGEDPGHDCAEAPGQPCGRDGFCDGGGGCRMAKAGTVCAPGTCTGATKTSARTCDGLGNCQPATTTSCLPAACNAGGSDCDTTCSNHPEGCPAGEVCSTLCGMPAICCRR